jgi:hypothetical protein
LVAGFGGITFGTSGWASIIRWIWSKGMHEPPLLRGRRRIVHRREVKETGNGYTEHQAGDHCV